MLISRTLMPDLKAVGLIWKEFYILKTIYVSTLNYQMSPLFSRCTFVLVPNSENHISFQLQFGQLDILKFTPIISDILCNFYVLNCQT